MKKNTANTTTITTHTTTTITAVSTTIITITALIMKGIVVILIMKNMKVVAATGITSNIGVARGKLACL
ncbi:hypothetical protein E5D97_06640 [Helicobacter pylori]|nr:hypothetical protein E5D97_06640 [Helicobacter pylori]